MNLFNNKEYKDALVIYQDVREIQVLHNKVNQTVEHLNTIIKHVPLSNYEEICSAKRNAKEIVFQIAIEKNPAFKVLAESNPDLKPPLTAELRELLNKLQAVDGFIASLLYWNGKAWLPDSEKVEKEADKYRIALTTERQKKRHDFAKMVAKFLNELTPAEQIFFFSNLNNLSLVVSHPPYSQIKDTYIGAFEPNPLFAANELAYIPERPAPAPHEQGPTGELLDMEKLSKKADHEPRKLKPKTPAEIARDNARLEVIDAIKGWN